jgi:hypothetical protein
MSTKVLVHTYLFVKHFIQNFKNFNPYENESF